MRYEAVHGVSVPKIGFGTWKIGGDSYPDPKGDPASLAALRSALEAGYTHFDTAEVYAGGHSEELLGRAIRETNTKRESLFITTKVDPAHLQHKQVLRSCENSLSRLKMDYVDLYLIHWPPRMSLQLDDAFRGLNQLVRDGKVKHLGVSNFNETPQAGAVTFETPILTDQVPYRLPDRTYGKWCSGILPAERHFADRLFTREISQSSSQQNPASHCEYTWSDLLSNRARLAGCPAARHHDSDVIESRTYPRKFRSGRDRAFKGRLRNA
jgi:aryl-alcohol dehydrogenase-like predicted oxidoreductase